MNHHFWGDISAWFIKRIAGICLNPSHDNVNEVRLEPHFIEALSEASGYHVAPAGKIAVTWRRKGEDILLYIDVPTGVSATLTLDPAYALECGARTKNVTSGCYRVMKT